MKQNNEINVHVPRSSFNQSDFEGNQTRSLSQSVPVTQMKPFDWRMGLGDNNVPSSPKQPNIYIYMY